MYTITATEFKTNFGKYIKLGQKEIIEVTSHGKKILSLVPEKITKYQDAMSLVGILPKDATFGIDPNERD